MLKILFLGYLSSKKGQKGFSDAGQKYQEGFLEGLINNGFEVEIISIKPQRSFPNNKLFIKEHIFYIKKILVENIKYINLPYFKYKSIQLKLNKVLRKKIKEFKPDLILSYNFFSYLSSPLIKSGYPKGQIIPILADLPISSNSNNFFSTLLFRNLYKKSFANLKRIEKCILLNNNASKYLSVNTKIELVESGISNNFSVKWDTYEYKNFVYAGSLDSYSGINKMIEAFSRFHNEYSEYQLDIYGRGNLENYVMDISNSVPGINFYGYVNNKDLQVILRKSYCLINLRPVDNPINYVTFPSKIFEYLQYCVPIITTSLNSWDKTYANFMKIIYNDDIETIYNTLVEFVNSNYAYKKQIAKDGLDFILNQKKWDQQVRKLFNLIDESKLRK